MKRTDAMAVIHAAAARGDIARCTQVFCEHRISRAVYDEAVRKGRAFGDFVRQRDAAAAAAKQPAKE